MLPTASVTIDPFPLPEELKVKLEDELLGPPDELLGPPHTPPPGSLAGAPQPYYTPPPPACPVQNLDLMIMSFWVGALIGGALVFAFSSVAEEA
jgi:hypothetical protein